MRIDVVGAVLGAFVVVGTISVEVVKRAICDRQKGLMGRRRERVIGERRLPGQARYESPA